MRTFLIIFDRLIVIKCSICKQNAFYFWKSNVSSMFSLEIARYTMKQLRIFYDCFFKYMKSTEIFFVK